MQSLITLQSVSSFVAFVMPPKKKNTGRWQRPHTEAIKALLRDGIADYENQTEEYIEEVCNNLDDDSVLCEIPLKNFIGHCKLKAAMFMSGKAVEGIRRSE